MRAQTEPGRNTAMTPDVLRRTLVTKVTAPPLGAMAPIEITVSYKPWLTARL
jgi:hypothetical protein